MAFESGEIHTTNDTESHILKCREYVQLLVWVVWMAIRVQILAQIQLEVYKTISSPLGS